MTDSEGAAAGGADAVPAEKDDALFVFQTDATGGGIFHLLNLELKPFDLFLTQSGDFLGNVQTVVRNVLACREKTRPYT